MHSIEACRRLDSCESSWVADIAIEGRDCTRPLSCGHFETRRVGSVASLPALPSDPALQGFRALHGVADTG